LSITTGAVGAAVTITGTNFGSTQGSGTVSFNGTAATVSSWSATSIAVTVPSGATTGNVVVFASGVNSNGVNFTVVPAPSISGLSPATGALGAAVTITGTNFGSTQGSGTVSFNGTAATVSSWSATSIAVTVPSGATTGNVVVFASGVNSNGVNFTVVPAPSITSLSITTGAVGAAVTITGTNFGSTQGSGTVSFNGTAATVSSWSATSIAVTVPSGATTGNVVVFASGVNSNGVSFTVVPAPTVTSLSPTSSAVGAAVTITGTNFGSTQGSGTVSFNGTAATVSSWSATSIAVTVPSGATTGNVVVFASGVNSNGVSFTVVGSPIITSLSITTGAVGVPITIVGTNFGATQGTGAVSFNGTAATVSSWSATSIAVTVPNGATSGNVVVFASGVNSNGIEFTVLNVFSYSRTITIDHTKVPNTDQTNFPFLFAGTDTAASQKVTDQNQKTTTYGYDDADRLTSVTDAANHTTTYAYDTEDNLVTVTDANTHSTFFTYDAFGRVTNANFPNSQSETYAYDANNNLTSKTDDLPPVSAGVMIRTPIFVSGPLFLYHPESESPSVVVLVHSRLAANAQAISCGVLSP
jgi:YD repeat-containing protein